MIYPSDRSERSDGLVVWYFISLVFHKKQLLNYISNILSADGADIRRWLKVSVIYPSDRSERSDGLDLCGSET